MLTCLGVAIQVCKSKPIPAIPIISKTPKKIQNMFKSRSQYYCRGKGLKTIHNWQGALIVKQTDHCCFDRTLYTHTLCCSDSESWTAEKEWRDSCDGNKDQTRIPGQLVQKVHKPETNRFCGTDFPLKPAMRESVSNPGI